MGHGLFDAKPLQPAIRIDFWSHNCRLGDLQPEHDSGVDLDNNTHKAIDIYDNAMFVIALNNLMKMIPAARQKLNPATWDMVKS